MFIWSRKDGGQMSITLTINNFLPFEHQVLTFESGTTLLHGDSGAGKTSVFRAIDFVLFGGRAPPAFEPNKPIEVTMVDDDWIISRRTSPKRIQISSVADEKILYSDNTAEAAILDRYGSRDLFLSSSMMRQKKLNQFLDAKKGSRLELIEALSLGNETMRSTNDEIEERLKAAISALSSQKATLITKLDVAKQLLEASGSQDAVLPDSLRATSKQELLDQQSEAQMVIDTAPRLESSLTLQLTQVQELDKRIEDLEARLNKMSPSASYDKQEEELTTDLIAVREQLDRQRVGDTRSEMLQQRADEIDLELETINKQIATLRRELGVANVTQSKLESVRSKLSTTQLYELALQTASVKDRSSAKSELDEVLRPRIADLSTAIIAIRDKRDRVQMHISQLKCPNCGTALQLSDDKDRLELCDSTVDIDSGTTLDKLDGELDELQKEETAAKVREAVLTQFLSIPVGGKKESKHYQKRLKDLEELLRLLDAHKKFTLDYSKLEKEIKALSTSAKEGELVGPDIIQANKDKIKDLESRLKTVANSRCQRTEIQNQLDELLPKRQDIDLTKLRNEIAELKTTIEAATITVSDCTKNLALIDLVEERRVHELKIQNLEKEVAEIRESLSLHDYIQVKCREARSICLTNTTDVLCSTIQQYADEVFDPLPISVNLSTVKVDKKDKAVHEVALTFDYKQIARREADEFSGGEEDRISLAATLAFNQLSGSRFVFLDETIGTVQSSLAETMVNLINDYAHQHNRIVVLIGHHSQRGDFDHSIRIK